MSLTDSTWTPSSWRSRAAAQQPDWPDPDALAAVRDRLQGLPPLVFAGEARALLAALGEVCEGRAFLLQAGDCVESFHDVSAPAIRERLKVLLQMSAVLTYAATPRREVGDAGQFAKPRTSPTEVVDGVELPSFRGHIVHSDEPTPEARIPDPERLVQGYYRLDAEPPARVHEGVRRSHPRPQLEPRVRRVVALRTVRGARRRDRARAALHAGDRVRPRKRADDPRGRRLDEPRGPAARLRGAADPHGLAHGPAVRLLCAHALDRGSHARPGRRPRRVLLRGAQPDRVKLGPTATADDAVRLAERLNPDRIPGRLTFVVRMGSERVRDALPPLLEAMRSAEIPVAWVCDPMHANTC